MHPDFQALASYKERLFEQLGLLGRALASPRRLELLDLLCQAERGVDELAQETGLSPSNVSQHLRVLKECHLVEFTRDGLHARYHIADPAVATFWQSFRELALGRLAEVRELLRAQHAPGEGPEAIAADDLARRLASGTVCLIDVRSAAEYRGGHLPGALSMPLAQLVDRLAELPRDRELVAYCRGPFCILADEAVRALLERGLAARRLTEGPREWQDRGFALETAPPPVH